MTLEALKKKLANDEVRLPRPTCIPYGDYGFALEWIHQQPGHHQLAFNFIPHHRNPEMIVTLLHHQRGRPAKMLHWVFRGRKPQLVEASVLTIKPVIERDAFELTAEQFAKKYMTKRPATASELRQHHGFFEAIHAQTAKRRKWLTHATQTELMLDLAEQKLPEISGIGASQMLASISQSQRNANTFLRRAMEAFS